MNGITTTSPLPAGTGATPMGRAARRVRRLLQALPVGQLELQWPDGLIERFGPGGAGAPRAAMQLHDESVCSAVLAQGDIGLAESYLDGHWHTPDLAGLLLLFVRNRDALGQAVYGGWWGGLLARLRHALNRNTRRGSRRNILAHYDLGNAFYGLWLDPSMNYSAGWFGGDRARTLEEAQAAKMRRALHECGVAPGEHVLEIGCGWGALAELAAGAFEARVTGVTLSPAQLAFARQRLARQGLGNRAELRLQDWRDIQDGPFDAIVSIEMFEAVGRAYWPRFFEQLARRLRPGGRACIQTITIRDDLFARYARSTDFIQQHVFPGGLLPSAGEFRAGAARAGLEPCGETAFGADYAETLRRWRARFAAAEPAVRAQGFDSRFVRLWDFYLAYCQAAFAGGSTDVVQFTLRRPC